MRTSYQKGLLAEKLSSLYLIFKGYRILETRYKTRMGEIDLIARKRNVIVFIEVKNRSDYETGAYSITAKAQKRISDAARHYISQNPQHQNLSFRFDALLFIPPFSFRHLDNVWSVSAY